MVGTVTDVGLKQKLGNRLTKAMAALAIAGTLVLGGWTLAPTDTVAGGETRTISLYYIHTKESLTVTYKKDGNYIPSAMKQINRLLRDWRRNEVTTIDPRTIDLVWELHADLKSQRPIHVVSGYRSPKTNAFLKKIGRKVAKKSQHMKGKAIDFYFPDVKTVNIRNSALVRRVGGVGYYRSSGGPTGFLHVDTGNVRTWGPKIGGGEMARIMRDKKTVGARFKGRKSTDMIEVASNENGAEAGPSNKKSKSLIGWVTGTDEQVEENIAPLEGAYTDGSGELGQLTADAADASVDQVQDEDTDDSSDENALENAIEPVPVAAAKKKQQAPDAAAMSDLAQTAAVEALADEELPEPKKGYPVIKPRLKPSSVMTMASADPVLEEGVTIQPANAPAESQNVRKLKKPSVVADSLAALADSEGIYGDLVEMEENQVSNTSAKTSFAAELRDGTTDEAPIIEPMIASANGADASWWEGLFTSSDSLLRRDGTPPSLDVNVPDVLPRMAELGDDGSENFSDAALVSAEGKGDSLFVNREGKGSLETTDLRLPKPATEQDLSALE